MIYEDCAIHKSVGQYVDRSARKKATAKTCYTRAAGLFVPQPLLADGTPMWHECLRADIRVSSCLCRIQNSFSQSQRRQCCTYIII